MSKTYTGGPITVSGGGLTLTSGVASASNTIPLDSAGNRPRYVRLTATAACYARMGVGAATATANDMLVQPADSVIVAVPSGVTHIATIQDSAGGKLNVVPLDNV